MTMLYTQTFSLHRPVELALTRHICEGAVQTINSVSLLYTIWSKYGEKLGLGERPSDEDSSSSVDRTLQQVVAKLRRHLSWYMGHIAYEFIKIENKDDQRAKEKAEAAGEEGAQKRKERRRKQVL